MTSQQRLDYLIKAIKKKHKNNDLDTYLHDQITSIMAKEISLSSGSMTEETKELNANSLILVI